MTHLSALKDGKEEMTELQEEGAGEDEDDEEEDDEEDEDERLSPEDKRRVVVCVELSTLTYGCVRKLYEFVLRCKRADGDSTHVQWMEAQVSSGLYLLCEYSSTKPLLVLPLPFQTPLLPCP
jgi:hypothetical protein